MKRTFAAVVLLASLGILFKLAWKRDFIVQPSTAQLSLSAAVTVDPESALRAKYAAPKDRDLVDQALQRYHHTAVLIEQTDGLRGSAPQ